MVGLQSLLRAFVPNLSMTPGRILKSKERVQITSYHILLLCKEQRAKTWPPQLRQGIERNTFTGVQLSAHYERIMSCLYNYCNVLTL